MVIDPCEKCDSRDVEVVREVSSPETVNDPGPGRTDLELVCRRCGHDEQVQTVHGD